MKIDRLFQVLVVAGASSVAGGVIGCGEDDPSPSPSGTGGAAASTGGAAGAMACDCKASTANGAWTDCNGCCCWLPPGATAVSGSPICGPEPCCTGKGR
jgi:hypothetical protein